MDYDEAKIDEAVLALLYLTSFQDHGVRRAWKNFPWEALDRLHDQRLIVDPKSKAKSVVLTDEGAVRAEELCMRLFGRGEG